MRKQVVWPRAPLVPAWPGSLGRRGLLTGGDEVPFWGAFQTLDRVLELEPQESVTHHPSTLEVAPVPRTPKNPSSAEPSKLSRAIWF